MDSRGEAGHCKKVRSRDLRMRDPFVLVDHEARRYYLYGTTDPDPWHGDGVGFDAYWSSDLENWHGPFPAFRPPPGFWAQRNFWAPEVYRHSGQFILFASFSAGTGQRAVQALRSEHALGPFAPHGEPLTPPEWQCLDGTLYREDDFPWLVFCHEWLQIDDGAIYRQQLSGDLRSTVGAPELLFRASEAPWVRPVQERHHFVTDGPFLHRCQDGKLLLLWSSFARRGYAVGLATSLSGSLAGPWRQQQRPFIQGSRRSSDGGHAMVFRDLSGELVLTLHRPNQTPHERPIFLPVEEHRGGLRRRDGQRHGWLRRFAALRGQA